MTKSLKHFRTTSTKDEKIKLREKMRQVRRGIPASERQLRSEKITNKLLQRVKQANYQRILCFYGGQYEVNTRELILKLLEQNKHVYLPFIHEHKIGGITDLESLRKDPLTKLLIPNEEVPFNEYQKIELVLVPGLGFNTSGERLGSGGGWYDRMLPKFGEVEAVGICYREQLLEQIPTASHDFKMHLVISA